MSNKKKYPKLVQDVMIEAPLAYGIVALVDFKSGMYSAAQTFANWNKFKRINKIEPVYHLSHCALHNEPAIPKGSCDCGVG